MGGIILPRNSLVDKIVRALAMAFSRLVWNLKFNNNIRDGKPPMRRSKYQSSSFEVHKAAAEISSTRILEVNHFLSHLALREGRRTYFGDVKISKRIPVMG
jgi:hypothetical protein